jgi:hypothetical protein
MLTITIPGQEFFDDESQEFISGESVTLELEHSLVSISKWESVYEKPFLGDGEKSNAEIYSYITMMISTPNFDTETLERLNEDNLNAIREYIAAKRSATWFREDPRAPRSREVITSELIYYWMVALTIPFECQNWHLNRLLTLIRVCNIKNAKPKKSSPAELAARNRELNAQRRAQMNTKG